MGYPHDGIAVEKRMQETVIDVSVVVPTYQRPDLLKRCLQALCAQTYDGAAYEVIVVDNAGSAETERIVTSQCKAQGADGPAIRYKLETESQGPAAARNRGWRAARGEIVAFTDDDCVPDSNWLREGLAAFDDGQLGVMGKTVVPLPPEPTDYQRTVGHLNDSHFITANCFYRRAVLEAAGGFDERFTAAWREDSDLFFTLQRAYPDEHLFGYAPEAVVCHPPRQAQWGVSLSQQRKSMFNALLFKKHPSWYRAIIQSSPPWRYYRIVLSLLGTLFAVLSGRKRAAALLLAVWALMTGRFAQERLRDTSRAPLHVAEMLFTSVLIPPLCIFWRLLGALRFRVFFL